MALSGDVHGVLWELRRFQIVDGRRPRLGNVSWIANTIVLGLGSEGTTEAVVVSKSFPLVSHDFPLALTLLDHLRPFA